VSSPNKVSLIEYAFGQSAKKAGHAIFEDLSSWTEQSGAMMERPAEIKQVVFVSACTVEKKQDRPFLSDRNKAMSER
jgi:hypothetical protein